MKPILKSHMTREEILADIKLLEELIETTRLGQSMFPASRIPGWESDLAALRARLREINLEPEPAA